MLFIIYYIVLIIYSLYLQDRLATDTKHLRTPATENRRDRR